LTLLASKLTPELILNSFDIKSDISFNISIDGIFLVSSLYFLEEKLLKKLNKLLNKTKQGKV